VIRSSVIADRCDVFDLPSVSHGRRLLVANDGARSEQASDGRDQEEGVRQEVMTSTPHMPPS
jgi:hypothetical protein